MKKQRSIATMILSAVLACIPVTKSHASTDCNGLTLTKVFTDNGGNFYVATGGNLNGYIQMAAPSYKTVVSIAVAAKLANVPVTIRYQRDGVTCGSALWNDVIEGIGM